MRALSQNFWVFRYVKTPFSPFPWYNKLENSCLFWFFYIGFSSPCTVCRLGTYTPYPLQCACACSELVASRPWRSCISGTYTFRFRVHAALMLVVSPCYFWTPLLLCGFHDSSSLLPFFLEKYCRRTLSARISLVPCCLRTILPGR